MYKQSTTSKATVNELFLQAGKRRRINVSQAEVSRLYDKNKNSYSKKFQMKMQLLNDPQRSLNRSLENSLTKHQKLGGGGSSKSKSRESLHSLEQEKEKDAKTTTKKVRIDDRVASVQKTRARTKTEEATPALNESLENYRDSTFIRIEGEEAYLENVDTIESLNEQYKQIIRQIENVKDTCELQQKKVKNAEESLKAKKKILAEQKKGVRLLQRTPIQIAKVEQQLNAEKEQIYLMTEDHKRKMAHLHETLQQIKEMKEAQMLKLETIDRLRAEEKANQERDKLIQVENAKRQEEQAILSRQKAALLEENRLLTEALQKLKETAAPPLDIHRKYIERLEKLAMQADMQRIDAYLRVKEDAKAQKKAHQRMKEELAKKKDEVKQLRKKLDDKKEQSEKLRKTMTDRAVAVLDLDQKFQQYDLKAR